MSVKLLKYLWLCGIDARRKLKEAIQTEGVLVGDRWIQESACLVDPQRDKIYFRGVRVRPQKLVYYVVNKPKGFICDRKDVKRRPCVVDLIPVREGIRVFPIGRLDVDSQGLILLTNDGELAQQVAHPRYEISKTYWVELRGYLAPSALERLRKGIWLSEGRTGPLSCRVVKRSRERTVLYVTLSEGKNREVRRVFAHLGYKVWSLKRVAIGHLGLGKLPPGGVLSTSREFLCQKIGLPPGDSAKGTGFPPAREGHSGAVDEPRLFCTKRASSP